MSNQHSCQQYWRGLSRGRIVLSTSVAFALFVFLGSSAMADAGDEANCTVFEIRASNSKGGIDPGLKPIDAKLKKPPFSAWNTFRLVKKHSAKAPLMKAISLSLSGGGKLGLLYKERSDSKGRKPRLRVGMTLDNASGHRKADITLKVDSGDFTLVGQDAGKDGKSRLLAIRCAVR